MTLAEIKIQHNQCNSRRGEHGGLGSAYHGVLVQDMRLQEDRHNAERLQAQIAAELPFRDISLADLYMWLIEAFPRADDILAAHTPYDYAHGIVVHGCVVRLTGLATGKRGYLVLSVAVSMTPKCPLWGMSKADVQTLLDTLAGN